MPQANDQKQLLPSSDRASSPIKSLLFLVESKTCHCTIMLNVLLYCSTIIGRLHLIIVSVREFILFKHNLRIIKKCKNSINKIWELKNRIIPKKLA